LITATGHNSNRGMKCHLAFALCGLLLETVHAAESWWRAFGEIKPGVFAGGDIDGDKKPPEQLVTEY